VCPPLYRETDRLQINKVLKNGEISLINLPQNSFHIFSESWELPENVREDGSFDEPAACGGFFVKLTERQRTDVTGRSER
jgi:hypothetical protein